MRRDVARAPTRGAQAAHVVLCRLCDVLILSQEAEKARLLASPPRRVDSSTCEQLPRRRILAACPQSLSLSRARLPSSRMRSFDNFSPYDFELFVADLLGTHLGVEFETFPRGADGGIDLRHIPLEGAGPRVVQCKHYAGSPFASLVSAAKKEAKHLKEMRPQPTTYQFVTTKSLTAANKRRLMTELQPWLAREQDVLGANDLEALLDKHPEVERRQVKLWLTGGTQLAALLSAGTIHRSQTLLEEIQQRNASLCAGPRLLGGSQATPRAACARSRWYSRHRKDHPGSDAAR